MTSSGIDRAPTILTERLRLRAHTLDDYETCVAMWSDPEVTRFIGGKPQTREEIWSRLLRYAGMWALTGKGFWVIEEKETGKPVGEVGVMEARRAMEPGFGADEPEVGWALLPAMHGKGYAGEAVKAAMAWADEVLKPPVLVCIISPENAPSIKLAEKLGFRERLHTTYHGQPTIQFESRRGGQ
jgi:RimJ/RimL family protein N-acetyltransferase